MFDTIIFNTICLSLFSAGSTFLSIIIYGAIIKEGIAWSFVMVTISGALYAVSGLLMLISFFNGRKTI